ncbi:hypothetical protein A176_001348 [Myxococcus hansupus]|uniref:GTPase n=1 Tax=Pseudomyxococcus hansupus TaxID=1297742 RepID=A0A0H4WM13_9BACT|nr:DUF697 domain-containing protein [Myxococcus hansupus]AKQ64436.1 hypothetical protein A176_001348 [Myxococcus hansupus]
MEETAKQEAREARGRDIVKKYSLWSMGAGALPLPGLDIAAFMVVQLRMLGELAELHSVSFHEQRARGVVAALLGAASSTLLGRPLVFSLLKGVPVIGSTAGVLSGAVSMAGLSRAIGRLFIQHFETGGTLLTFDAKAMRAHFMREFEKNEGAEVRSATPPPVPGPAV